MAYVQVPGGVWVPTAPSVYLNQNQIYNPNDTATVSATQEEFQILGNVYLAAGSGSKTFGTSGSKVGWLPGASITFAVNSTLRVGAKKAATFDNATGPAGRATAGSAFDVYKDLLGGTDTITSTTWREDAMASGTPFTVTHGDKIAICFYLTTTGGSPSVKIRGSSTNGNNPNWPAATLITSSGTAFSPAADQPNVILYFDDGTIGWIEGSYVHSAQTSDDTIGNTNLYGNIFQFPMDCKIDAVRCLATLGVGTTNGDIGLWSDPLGTPAAMSNGTVSFDPQNVDSTGQRWATYALPAEQTIAKNTPVAAAIKQNSASDFRFSYYDVSVTSHFQANGLDSNCYAAKSTAGGAFAAQNSGKRRMGMFVRISSLAADSAGAGGGLLTHPGMAGGARG